MIGAVAVFLAEGSAELTDPDDQLAVLVNATTPLPSSVVRCHLRAAIL